MVYNQTKTGLTKIIQKINLYKLTRRNILFIFFFDDHFGIIIARFQQNRNVSSFQLLCKTKFHIRLTRLTSLRAARGMAENISTNNILFPKWRNFSSSHLFVFASRETTHFPSIAGLKYQSKIPRDNFPCWDVALDTARRLFWRRNGTPRKLWSCLAFLCWTTWFDLLFLVKKHPIFFKFDGTTAFNQSSELDKIFEVKLFTFSGWRARNISNGHFQIIILVIYFFFNDIRFSISTNQKLHFVNF